MPRNLVFRATTRFRRASLAADWSAKQLSSAFTRHHRHRHSSFLVPSVRLFTSPPSSFQGIVAPKNHLQFGTIQAKDVEVFADILEHQPGTLFYKDIMDNDGDRGNGVSDVLDYASIDWTGHWKSETSLVLRPQSTEQVSRILAHCHAQKLPVVPQGGKTGLVGGSIPSNCGEIVLQLQRLNQIQSIDPVMGIVQCQGGVILQTLQEYCADHNLLVPIDLGAKGTCQIGGNLATNAGGQYFRRYGSLAGNVLGLQVVLADGRVLDLNFGHQATNLKDNTGYKLHQLFLGSEGTLGIITGVAMACTRQPISRQAAMVACPTYESVLRVILKAKEHLGETLAAMELMDAAIWKLLTESGHHKMPMSLSENNDYGDQGPFVVLVDTHGSNMEHDQAKLELFVEAIAEEIVDGVIAQDGQQYEAFWRIRESANETIARQGYTYKYDISLPIAEFADWIHEMRRERLAPLSLLSSSSNDDRIQLVNGNWGHVLDGNLHFNVASVGDFQVNPAVLEALEPYLFESVLRRGGSVSAEHGLGQAKNQLLSSIHSPATLQVMRDMKGLLDPHGILNPNKFLPADQ